MTLDHIFLDGIKAPLFIIQGTWAWASHPNFRLLVSSLKGKIVIVPPKDYRDN